MHLENKIEGFSYYDILNGQGQYFNPEFIPQKDTITVKGYVSDIITAKAINWVEQQNTPFCLIIGHKAPHRNWLPDPQDFRLNDTVDFEIPETFFDTFKGREAAKKNEMSIADHLSLHEDLKLFESLDAMKKDFTLSRLDSAQFNAYAAYYLPIAEKLKRDNLTGKDLA